MLLYKKLDIKNELKIKTHPNPHLTKKTNFSAVLKSPLEIKVKYEVMYWRSGGWKCLNKKVSNFSLYSKNVGGDSINFSFQEANERKLFIPKEFVSNALVRGIQTLDWNGLSAELQSVCFGRTDVSSFGIWIDKFIYISL